MWPFLNASHSFTFRKFLLFFYELIKDQSIEKKLYYYSVGVCAFLFCSCECSSVCLSFSPFFFFHIIIFHTTKKNTFFDGVLLRTSHFLFVVSLFAFSFPNGGFSFWQIDCLKLDSGLVVFYWARMMQFLIVVIFIKKWKIVVCVVLFLYLKISYFPISIFLRNFSSEKKNVIFFHQSLSTGEKKNTKPQGIFLFNNYFLCIRLYQKSPSKKIN